MRLTVVGNPGSRRVTMFTAAAIQAGLAEPDVVAWRDVAAGKPIRLRPGCLVRIESPGEDAEVDRLLRGASEPAQYGEIVGGAQWYAGFGRALERISKAAREQGATLIGDPGEIMVMFDKTAGHARLSAAGVPVPAALPAPICGWQDLKDQLAQVGWQRVFVKPRHGSSASGVIALRFGGAGRMLATTSVERDGDRLFNSLRVRRYEREHDIAAIVDQLAPDGLHVEQWFPKAQLNGHVIDLRVLVVSGEPSHVVVRGSRHPMTNLHLGGVRGDLSALREQAGPAYREGLLACRAAAAACFPNSLHAGVDLMFGVGYRSHAIAEVNAFGDLLPGLLVDGRDTYGAQVAALKDRVG